MSEKTVLLDSCVTQMCKDSFLFCRKNGVKKALILLATLLMCVNVKAYDFAGDDGFYYDVVSEDTVHNVGTVKITGAVQGVKFKASMTINTVKIEDNPIRYTVVEIANSGLWNCMGLTHLTIGNSVTNIGSFAFSDCPDLKTVSIGSGVASIGDYAFKDCGKLSSVYIPYSVTAIGNGMFYGCKGLTSMEIPNSIITIGEDAFRNCSGLISVIIPEAVKKIGEGAFYGCRSMTDIIVDDSNNQYSSIDGALYTKDKTELVVFPGGKTSATFPDAVQTIGNSAFWGCSGLTSVEIPNSVTTIGENAFWGCVELSDVTIGSSVSKIGDYAFGYCNMLTSIHCQATTPPDAPDNIFDFYTLNGTLYVPTGSVEKYESVEPWSSFINIEEFDFGGVACVDDTTISVITNGGHIEIRGAVESEIEVYNLSGQLVYRGTDTVINVPVNGLYIVRVAGQTFKVAVGL